MTKPEKSIRLFEEGFNCAQSVLFPYGEEFFKESAYALKIATGFGAGISYRGEMCGAVSGALMVIGLHYGSSDLNSDKPKERTVKMSKEFIEAFESINGSVICNQLLKTEINTPEGLEYARQNGLFKKTCPDLVESGAKILEGLLQKYPINNLNNE